MLNKLLQFIILIKFGFFASSQLIPLGSQHHYEVENKVLMKELNINSNNYEGETSYTFNSLLKINSVWHSEEAQLLQIYFLKSYVTAPTKQKKGNEKVQEITNIPDRPFYISMLRNKPHKVIAHTSRDQSLLNLKRGIASLLQLQFEEESLTEVDVSGSCNVRYRIKSTTKIEKTKTDCTHWDLKVRYRPEKSMGAFQVSQEVITYELSADSMLLKATSIESHRLAINAKPDLGSEVKSVFTLKHKESISEPAEQLNFDTLDEAVTSLLEWYRIFEIEADVDGTLSELKNMNLKEEILHYKDALDDDMIGHQELAEAFTKLLPLARLTKQAEFTEILQDHKALQSQLVDLLGSVQSIEAHRAINEVFDYNRDADRDYLEKYLQSLAVGTHCERSIIEDLLERLKDQDNPILNIKLTDTMLQTMAALTRQSNFEKNDALHKEILNHILNSLEEKCSKKDAVCKTRYIRALGNLQDASTIDVLLNYTDPADTVVSVAAMQALHNIPVFYYTENHRRMFEQIFYQIQQKYDSSARTFALEILLKMKVTQIHLAQLLNYLNSNDKHFEIKTYVVQKLSTLAQQCPKFREMLSSSLHQRPHINNYHILGQKGLTTVLMRELSRAPALNESLLSIQEIYRGVLKRGSVELLLEAGENKMSTFKLGLYTNGLTSFVGDSTNDIDDYDDNADSGPVTAGMEITVQGVVLRPLVFFNGQTELMGHVWSGTASEPTPAFQATILDHDHEHYIILSSGSTAYICILGFKSINLFGQVQFSLWNRNAQTEITQKTASALRGIMKAGFTYAELSNEFSLITEPHLNLQADLDFYSGIKLCIQLQRSEAYLRQTHNKSVKLQASTRYYTKHMKNGMLIKFPGRTLALNQKNNEMCNILFE